MIHLEEYISRVFSIVSQFDYIRNAIMGFIAATEPEAYAAAKAHKWDFDMDWLLDPVKAQLQQGFWEAVEAKKGGFPDDKKELENRIAQNEIILLIAVFEDQIKQIHLEILRRQPTLLNAERKIDLGRLAALGGAAVIEEEIQRAVQLLDRQNVSDKAKAFEKLGFAWNVEVERIEYIIKLRNTILHEDMNHQDSIYRRPHQDCP